jgi:hypothetical protein
VILSEELRTNIQKAIDGDCKSIDSKCIDSVKSLLVNPHTELESRQVLAVMAGLIALVSLTIPLWEDKNQGVPVALHMPPAQLDSAASAANAATMAAVTNSGAPFVTIVATPTAPVTTPAGYVCRQALKSRPDVLQTRQAFRNDLEQPARRPCCWRRSYIPFRRPCQAT